MRIGNYMDVARERGRAPKIKVRCVCGRWAERTDVTPSWADGSSSRVRVACKNKRCNAAPVVQSRKLQDAVNRAALEGRDHVVMGVDLAC